jgi:shikimate O-hydroxycinnamoyltransferase
MINNSIPLSPIDHVFTGQGSYPIEFVFAYNTLIDEQRLLSSFNEVLNYFPPMTSKLELIDGAYWFRKNQEGYHFEVVRGDVSFDETDDRELFIDPVNTVEGEPLTRIRLTQTPKGSVLGVSISHSVADGFSYFYFLAGWARIFHGKSIVPPSHERALLNYGYGKVGENQGKELLENCGLFLDKKRTDIDRDKLRWETINFSESELKSLLGEAQKECEVRLSFNDVVVATLWKRYMKQWRKNDSDDMTYISCPFDYRRFLTDFPKTYFGNAVALATISLSYENLMAASLAELAIMVRKGIGSISAQYIREGLSTLRGITKKEGVQINEKIHVTHPTRGLLVTNLSRLPVKEIEFNAGPPAKFEILTPANRGAVMLPGQDGIEVRVCCPFD